ncbi:MAG: GTP pyrophosphokinase family protein [Desulfobaccales bacterium]
MEPKTPEDWGREYKEKYFIYEAFTKKLNGLFHELLQGVDFFQIESRTKKVGSFTDKIQREGKNYSNPIEEITDLVGIRIICYYSEDVDIIGNIINDEFYIDPDKSIDKTKTLDPDKFGYLSVHYIISLSENRNKLKEWKQFSNFMAEVQVKTVLQHAWAAIDHKLRYKTKIEVPKDLIRKLFRLSALLELADDEFLNLKHLKNKLEDIYSKQLEKRELDIDINQSSLEVYFDSTKVDLKWVKIAEDIGFLKVPLPRPDESMAKDRSRLMDCLSAYGINKIKELDNLINAASVWGQDNLNKIFTLSVSKGFIPFAVSFDIITILVICAKKGAAIDKYTFPFREELNEALKVSLQE